jgi:hypothetical protein
MSFFRLKWLRRWFEKLLGYWYENVVPPKRFAEHIQEFSAKPHTDAQWRKFTTDLTRHAYQTGFVRGFEADERTERFPDPDEVADFEHPGWRDNSPPVNLAGELIPAVVEPPPAPTPPHLGSEEARLLASIRRRRVG